MLEAVEVVSRVAAGTGPGGAGATTFSIAYTKLSNIHANYSSFVCRGRRPAST